MNLINWRSPIPSLNSCRMDRRLDRSKLYHFTTIHYQRMFPFPRLSQSTLSKEPLLYVHGPLLSSQNHYHPTTKNQWWCVLTGLPTRRKPSSPTGHPNHRLLIGPLLEFCCVLKLGWSRIENSCEVIPVQKNSNHCYFLRTIWNIPLY